MALSRPNVALLLSLWQSSCFYILFLCGVVLSGAWFGLLLAFIVASVTSFLYRTFLTRVLPVPAKSAVLITGCSSGIGEDAALRLLSLGFVVFATVRKQQDAHGLKAKAASSSSGSERLIPLLCDVTRAEDIDAAVSAVRQRLEQDGLQLLGVVCNAGYSEFSPVELLPLSALRSVLETNVIAAFAVTTAFLPFLRIFASSHPSHSARVLLVSSIAAHMPIGGNAAYAASKAALESAADALRVELSRWRIAVSLLEPGAFATRFNAKTAQRLQANGEAAEQTAASRVGQPVLTAYRASRHRLLRKIAAVPVEAVSVCSDAIERCLLDDRPLSRMTAGWTSLVLFVVRRLPVELYDRIMGSDYS